MSIQGFILTICLCCVTAATWAQTVWTETYRGVENSMDLPTPPQALQPWYTRLAQDVRPQWQSLLQDQLTNDCHSLQLPSKGQPSAMLAGRYGLQWFDASSGTHQRFLSQRMQRQLTEQGEQRLASRQLETAQGTRLIWQDVQPGLWRAITLLQGRLQQVAWQTEVAATTASWLAASPMLGVYQQHSVLLVPANAQDGFQLIEVQSGRALWQSERSDREIVAAPAAVDSDRDGQWDRFYQVDVAGHLWQVQLSRQGVVRRDIADLSASGWQFDGAVNAVRGRWPDADGQWVYGDMLMLTARASPYGLVVLPISDQHHDLFTWSALANAGHAAPNQGWFFLLGAKPLNEGKVMGGVFYQALQHDTSRCDASNSAHQLLALHLYSGAAIYPTALLDLPKAVIPTWQLRRRGDQLQLLFDETVVVDALAQLDGRCSSCTQPINLSRLNRWRTLAWFSKEQGAY